MKFYNFIIPTGKTILSVFENEEDKFVMTFIIPKPDAPTIELRPKVSTWVKPFETVTITKSLGGNINTPNIGIVTSVLDHDGMKELFRQSPHLPEKVTKLEYNPAIKETNLVYQVWVFYLDDQGKEQKGKLSVYTNPSPPGFVPEDFDEN